MGSIGLVSIGYDSRVHIGALSTETFPVVGRAVGQLGFLGGETGVEDAEQQQQEVSATVETSNLLCPLKWITYF